MLTFLQQWLRISNARYIESERETWVSTRTKLNLR